MSGVCVHSSMTPADGMAAQLQMSHPHTTSKDRKKRLVGWGLYVQNHFSF